MLYNIASNPAGKKGVNKVAKTSMADMHEILFQQLEAISNPDLHGEELREEIQRGQSMCRITEQIINNGNLAYRVAMAKLEFGQEYQGEVDYLIESPERTNKCANGQTRKLSSSAKM